MPENYGEIKEVRRSDQLLSLEWKVSGLRSFDVNYESPRFSFCDGRWVMTLMVGPTGWTSFILHRYDDTPKTLDVAVVLKGSDGVQMRKEVEHKFTREKPCWYVYNICKYNARNTITLEMKIPSNARDNVSCPVLPAEIDTQCRQTNALAGADQLLDKQDEPIHEDEVKLLDEGNQSSEKEESDILLRSDQNVLKNGEDSEVSLKEKAVGELLSSFQSLLESEEDCDVVIKVQGKEFRVHRNILRARSPVFQAMFTHDMVEKQKGVVTMEDCDQDTFPAFLKHIYTGSIEMITSGNVFSLYTASEKYDLKTLKKACTEFVKKNLTVACFCNAVTLAVKHDDKELIECATEFFCNNALDVVQTAEWQIFLAENPIVGNELYIKQLKK